MIFDVVTNKLFKDLLAGTVPAGDSKKLNGLAAEEFVSNENLLINSDFKNPVNSSGKTSWSGVDVALFDGWKTYSAQLNAISLIDSGVKIANTWQATGNKTTFGTATSIKLKAGTYTLSMNIVEKVGTWFAQFHKHYQLKDGVNTITTTFDTDTEVSLFFFKNSAEADAYIVLEYIKLERGSVATPFIPQNKEVEKLKCGKADADTVNGLHAHEFRPVPDNAGQPFPDIKAKLEWQSEGTDVGYMKWRADNDNGTSYKTMVDNAKTVNGVKFYNSFTEVDSTFSNQTPLGEINNKMQMGSILHATVWNGSSAVYPEVSGFLEIHRSKGGYSDFKYIGRHSGKIWTGGGQADIFLGWAAYLPTTGGKITASYIPLQIDNATVGATSVGIGFLLGGVEVGNLGFDNNKPIYYDTAKATAHDLLHTGNSQKVTITASADTPPAEMSGLWAY